MADTAIANLNLTEDGEHVNKNQVIVPNYRYGVVALADTLNHAMIVDGRGKGRMTVFVKNETNQTITVTVYGAHNSDSDPADLDVLELGGSGASQFTVTTGIANYECYNDPFPFYIIRITTGSTPTSANVTIYVSFQQQ